MVFSLFRYISTWVAQYSYIVYIWWKLGNLIVCIPFLIDHHAFKVKNINCIPKVALILQISPNLFSLILCV